MGFGRVWLGGLLGALAACQGGGVSFVDPPPPPSTELRLTLVPDPEDMAVAQALGWNGRIPGAEARLTPVDSSAPTRVVTSSAQGLANFGELPPNTYILEVRRWLTPLELGQIPASQDANGWVSSARIVHGGSSPDLTYPVPASRQRSLVISEWALNMAAFSSTGTYPYGGFLELYNNTDTTIYLDGILILKPFSLSFDFPNFPCAANAAIANDPLGVWVRDFARFPGTGTELPLLAGRTAVVAMDAINHAEIVPLGIDLSHADYELIGAADVDNPTAVNVPEAGERVSGLGRGLLFNNSSEVLAIAMPQDLLNGTRGETQGSPDAYYRVPRQSVLDLLSVASNYEGSLYPACPRLVHANLDRAPSRARLPSDRDGTREYPFSLSRRVASVLPDGRRILQHSRSGDADFVRALRSPGSLRPDRPE